MYFITNIDDLKASEITEIYKMRWGIEVFFRFLKQELNFKHLVSRTQNEILVMLYMTLITAMLLMIYKQTNEISGYKIEKINLSMS
jgi:IS4 transposase